MLDLNKQFYLFKSSINVRISFCTKYGLTLQSTYIDICIHMSTYLYVRT